MATIGKTPVVALAYWIFGLLGTLAVLVPRLGANKRKAEEFKAQVDNAIEGSSNPPSPAFRHRCIHAIFLR